MKDHVIYDGNCNLCVTLVQLLESLDQGQQFQYTPMQDPTELSRLGLTSTDCELGMILVDGDRPTRRWQGSDAAEEIGKRLPGGDIFITAYQTLPGLKWMGDRVYEQIRDHRYTLFGQRSSTYQSAYPGCCGDSKGRRGAEGETRGAGG
ncbi:MAG: DCC1-like thiol-disulfide oxidoreductase family protein [Microcoleaceae cyanobacterium]